MNQEISIVVKQKVAQTDFQEVVSFNDVYRLKFTFDEEWADYPARVAVVMWADGAAERLFTGTECEMPRIGSLDAESVLIGVYSRRGEESIASSFVRVRCLAGAGGVLRPKPSASLHEQVLSFLNEKDWSVFEEKVAEGVYSAVRVSPIGLVKEGWKIIELGKEGQTQPGTGLAAGGIFFRKKNGAYTLCYYDGSRLEAISTSSASSLKSFPLTVGKKQYDGSEEVTITSSDLELAKVATSGDFLDLVNAPSYSAPVSSVNGKTGDVVIDAAGLGLSTVATSGSYNDLSDRPDIWGEGNWPVTSVNGQKGEVVIDAESLGLGALAMKDTLQKEDIGISVVQAAHLAQGIITNSKIADKAVDSRTLADKSVIGTKLAEDVIAAGANISVARDAESGVFTVSTALETGVTSVNGKTGDVTLDKDSLGLADVAFSGSFSDLVGAPESGVLSVNGKTGAVVIDRESLGLAKIAETGNYTDLVGAPESGVLSVNGKTGAVVLDKDSFGFSKVAESGSYNDLTDKPEVVASVNGQSGEITVDADSLGLGALAKKNTVAKGDIEISSIQAAHLVQYTITNSKIADKAVDSRVLADKSVKGTKLAEGVIVGGDNVTVTRNTDSGIYTVSIAEGSTMEHEKDIREGGDFNDLTKSGFYQVTGTPEHPCSNYPSSVQNLTETMCNWFVMVVAQADGAAVTQFAISAKSDCALRIRARVGSVWGDWKNVSS